MTMLRKGTETVPSTSAYPPYYLLLGSNQMQEESILRTLHLLKSKTTLTGVSKIYITSETQPNFWNMAVRILSSLDPGRLKTEILDHIETEVGRVTDIKGAKERDIIPMDIDIIFCGQMVTSYLDGKV